MNIKKSFLVALAAATAISSVTALTASAAELGKSDSTASASVVADGETLTAEVKIGDIEVALEADSDKVPEGSIVTVAIVENTDVQTAIDDLGIKESLILDITVKDLDGKELELKDAGVKVKITTNKYDTVYVYEDGSLKNLNAAKSGDALSFTAPHFSYFVLSKGTGTGSSTSTTSTAASTTGTSSKAGTTTTGTTTTTSSSTGKGDSVTTGDSATATTVAIFAVMGIVALGTAVVASKTKKASK